MVAHRVAGAPLDFAALRTELAVPGDFPRDVLADAEAAANGRLTQPVDAYTDETGIPFVTIDPPGSMDLDQAVHIARQDKGFLVSYAIADVNAYVAPGSPLSAETLRRGETIYFPDARVPLHPQVLSEGAASLLPDQIRPAVLWQFTLDVTGEVTSTDVRRAHVRSVAKLDYASVQQGIDAGNPHQSIALLPDVGTLRQALARARHSIDLDLPEQEVEKTPDGQWTLVMRAPLPVEKWNAEISLLTGMAAASIMLDAGFGVLRTVPPPDARAVAKLQHGARALGVDWPDGAAPGDVLATLDRSDGKHVAFIDHAASLLRGSGYTVFDGAPPAQPLHAGIAAPYAHVTAPLRRLVDRFGLEICLAAQAKQPVPQWVRDTVPQLPDVMAASGSLSHKADRAVVDMAEAWLLQDRIGQSFEATVIDADDKAATIVLDEPAVKARCNGNGSRPEIGSRITAKLIEADVNARVVKFESG